MEQQGILSTLAEIAAVFIGFASLAMAIGRNKAGQLTDLGNFRLRSLLETGLGCIFISLLPILLIQFGMEAPLLWQVSSLIAAAIFLAVTTVNGVKFRTMHKIYADQVRLGGFFAMAFVMGPIVMVILICNGLGIFFKGQFSIFLAAAMYTLLICAVQFLLLIFRTNASLASGPEGATNADD
jgi:hypothetical protein